jgi:transposase
LHDIGGDRLAGLPAGQRRVAAALVMSNPDGTAPSYHAVAERLSVHVGTVYRQLGRIRARKPDLFAALMAERRRRPAARHVRAVARAAARSEAWHRRRANARFRQEFGRWPWQARWQ